MTLFDRVWAITCSVEGGHNPDDAGSDTWYGIRRADNPDLPWPPTLEQAKARALERYWTEYHFEKLPPMFAAAAFDWIFNGGPAIRDLQLVLGVERDGWIGRRTAEAAHALSDPADTLAAYMTQRGLYLATLHTWPDHAATWLKRLFTIHRAALALGG